MCSGCEDVTGRGMRGELNDNVPENDVEFSALKCCILSRASEILPNEDGKRITSAERSGWGIAHKP